MSIGKMLRAEAYGDKSTSLVFEGAVWPEGCVECGAPQPTELRSATVT